MHRFFEFLRNAIGVFLAASLCAGEIRALDLGSPLDDSLNQLYAFRIPTTDRYGEALETDPLNVVLSFARHDQSISLENLFLTKQRKFTIFFAKRGELKAFRSVSFYFGGSKQYVAYFDQDEKPIVGSLGEVAEDKDRKVYVGRRSDPSFIDMEALEGQLKAPCRPQKGLRCDDSKAKNSFEDAHAAIIAIQVPVYYLTRKEDPETGSVRVWAKSYVAK